MERDDQDCAICLQKYHHPTQLPCSHVFCFLCVKGIAILSKKCAICRSQIPLDYFDNPVLLENLMAEEILAPESDKYHWYYEGRNGWWKYDERSNIDLENAYNSTGTECLLLLAGTLYCVDFQNMVQFRRSDPTKRRKVKRDIPSLPSKGIAGIKSINTRQTDDLENTNNTANREGGDVIIVRNVDINTNQDASTISIQSVHMIDGLSDTLSQIDLQREEMLSRNTDDVGLQDSTEEI